MNATGPQDPDYASAKALFSEICDLPDLAAQQARLQALGAAPELARRVLALAGLDQQATRISAPVAGMLASAVAAEPAIGERLGAWTLVGELGRGGMGQVLLAERSDGHYQQRAAIKLLKGWSGEAALAQLARERQILASLNHPHIARLIDGGSTPGGQPYLVMDHVDGQRIDQYQRERGLDLEGTLTLFEQVCDAVAYAHRQMVVHCDIKPGNVLVGPDGRAMLLDFGIAQLQGKKKGPDDPGPLALTPRYASPEQRAGAPASAASDVYSLGRMLDELLRALQPPPGRAREWQAIVQRASAQRPQDRYRSVEALLADLKRFRLHRPLAALPGNATYLTRKFLRRRWPWVLAGGGTLALSLAFTLRVVQERDRALQAEALAQVAELRALADKTLAQQARAEALSERDQAAQARAQAQHERDGALAAEAQAAAERGRAELARRQAQREADTTRQVSDFLVSLFEGADPRQGGNPELSAVSLVERGRERLATDLAGQPALQATMKGVLAKVYENMGRPRSAIELYEQALALERARPVPQPLLQAALLTRLAVALANDGQAMRAVEPARQAHALRLAALPPDALELAETHNNLGLVLTRGDALAEARQHLERALAIRRARHSEEHLDVAIALHNLGMLEQRAEQPLASEARYREALAIKLRLLKPEHPSVLITQQSLASVLAALNRGDEAAALLREVLTRWRALHGPNSAAVGGVLNELAGALQDGGRLTEAIATYQEALSLDERIAGRSPATIAIAVNNLATALEDRGDPAAQQRYRESLSLRLSRLKPDDPAVARAQHNLGRWLMRAGRLDEAEPLLRQAEQSRLARLPAGHGDRLESTLALAELALLRAQADEASARLDGLSALGQRPLRQAALARVQGLLATARGDKAAALLLHEQALLKARQNLAAGHPQLLRLRLDLACAYRGAGQVEPARRQLDEASAALRGQHPQSSLLAQARALGWADKTQDKP